MPDYIPYGWQNAPEGWKIGDAIPDGYETSAINATNLEAFAQHVFDTVFTTLETLGLAVQVLKQDPDTGEYPDRVGSAVLGIWFGWTPPNELGAPDDDLFIPQAEPA